MANLGPEVARRPPSGPVRIPRVVGRIVTGKAGKPHVRVVYEMAPLGHAEE